MLWCTGNAVCSDFGLEFLYDLKMLISNSYIQQSDT